MDRRRFLKVSGMAATGVVGVTAGCSSPSGSDGETSPTGGDGASNTIQMVTGNGNYYFDPIGLLVESGETVTWEIQSGAHSTTAYAEGNGGASVTRIPGDAEAWDSGTLTEQGATFEHTFDVSGTYDYFCIPHKSLGMVGRVVVDEPGGPADGSMPPDGEVPTGQAIVDGGAVSFDEFSN